MTSETGPRDYAAEALERLQQRGIVANPRFAADLQRFITDGLNRAVQEGASQGQFDAAWEQLINVTVDYAGEAGTDLYNAKVFTAIKRRICPGFWPFC